VASAEALSRDKWDLMGIYEPSRQPGHANVHEVMTVVAYTDEWCQQGVLSSAHGDLLSSRHGKSFIPSLLARLAMVRLAGLIPMFSEPKTSIKGPMATIGMTLRDY
jgi:hypothetical protein